MLMMFSAESDIIKCWVLCVEWFCIGFRFYLGCKHRLEIKKFARLPRWPIQAQYLSRVKAWTNETLPVFWWEIGPGWGRVNLPFLFLFQHKTSSDNPNVHISVMVAWHPICDLVNAKELFLLAERYVEVYNKVIGWYSSHHLSVLVSLVLTVQLWGQVAPSVIFQSKLSSYYQADQWSYNPACSTVMVVVVRLRLNITTLHSGPLSVRDVASRWVFMAQYSGLHHGLRVDQSGLNIPTVRPDWCPP